MKYAMMIGCVASLAACGGTSVPIADNPPAPVERLSFNEIADVAQDVNDGFNAVDITPKDLVPQRGFASFDGAVGGTFAVQGNVTEVGGLMQADVDFGRNRIDGQLGNFVTQNGDDLDGTLRLRNGVLNRQSNSRQVAIFADVDGNLRSAAGEFINVDARLRNAGFKGDRVDFIGGDITGDIFVDGVRGDIDMRTQLER